MTTTKEPIIEPVKEDENTLVLLNGDIVTFRDFEKDPPKGNIFRKLVLIDYEKGQEELGKVIDLLPLFISKVKTNTRTIMGNQLTPEYFDSVDIRDGNKLFQKASEIMVFIIQFMNSKE